MHRNKGTLSGQVPSYNFYFVALLVYLVKQFSITFHILTMEHFGNMSH